MENVIKQGETNRATFEFVRGLYYYYADNPVWHIFKANALKAANVRAPIQSRQQNLFV